MTPQLGHAPQYTAMKCTDFMLWLTRVYPGESPQTVIKELLLCIVPPSVYLATVMSSVLSQLCSGISVAQEGGCSGCWSTPLFPATLTYLILDLTSQLIAPILQCKCLKVVIQSSEVNVVYHVVALLDGQTSKSPGTLLQGPGVRLGVRSKLETVLSNLAKRYPSKQ